MQGRTQQGFWIGRKLVIVALLLQAAGCGVSDRLRARIDLKHGNESYLSGDYRSAIEHYDEAVGRVPTFSRAYLNKAYSQVALFRASVDFDERRSLADSAASSFLRYRELAAAGHAAGDDDDVPDAERVDQHILTLYLDTAQTDKAIALLEARLQSHPRDMAALQMLANLAVEQGDLETALRWHRHRLQIEPAQPEAYHALAVMVWRFSHKDMIPEDQRDALLDEGVRASERAIELRPDYYEALIYANLLYREKARFTEDNAQKAEFEKRYLEYEERARQVRQAEDAKKES